MVSVLGLQRESFRFDPRLGLSPDAVLLPILSSQMDTDTGKAARKRFSQPPHNRAGLYKGGAKLLTHLSLRFYVGLWLKLDF